MHFEGRRPSHIEIPVTEVSYDAVNALRVAWHQEEFPGRGGSEYHADAREVGLALGTRSLAVQEDSRPVAFAALDVGDGETEISGLYVLSEYRGHGRGTALTQTAIAAAGEVEHLWICADDVRDDDAAVRETATARRVERVVRRCVGGWCELRFAGVALAN